ncbi:hypothetical protein [Limnohabitans sp.]
MSANASPMFTRVGSVQGGVTLTTAAADYTGQGILNSLVFQADPNNGSFLQKLRFKALGTNVASVARIYLNPGTLNLPSALSAVSGIPTGIVSTGAGNLWPGNYYARIQAVDSWGAAAALSAETAAVAVSTAGSTISWEWSAVSGASKYRVFVGPVSGGQVLLFETLSNSLVMTTVAVGVDSAWPQHADPGAFVNSNLFYGEANLPATTISASVSSPEVEYPMNLALPPSFEVVVGLGNGVAAGWVVTGVGGHY